MPQNYVPIFIFVGFIAILIPVTLIRVAGDADLPLNPCGRLHLDLEEGRFGVGVSLIAHG